MSWVGLSVGARWPKCGHPKTPENTQTGHRQSPRCRECHRQRGREYWERVRDEAFDRIGVADPDPRAELLGGEFVRARQRWAVNQKAILRRRASPELRSIAA